MIDLTVATPDRGIVITPGPTFSGPTPAAEPPDAKGGAVDPGPAADAADGHLRRPRDRSRYARTGARLYPNLLVILAASATMMVLINMLLIIYAMIK